MAAAAPRGRSDYMHAAQGRVHVPRRTAYAKRRRLTMGGVVKSGNFAHDAACLAAENTRQQTVAGVAQSPAGQASYTAAEIAYHRAVIASAKANNSNNGLEASLSTLKALGVNS